MNLETGRLVNGKKLCKGVINSRKLKDSREYYALAVLKTLFPDEYNTLMRKETDRPDLKDLNDLYGVEVTTADSQDDNEENKLLSFYRNGNKKKIKEIIESHKNKISEINGVTIVSSGGQYAVDKDNSLLINSIYAKTESANKYVSRYNYLDLVLIKNELVPSVWEEEIFGCVDRASDKSKRVFRNVFLIYRDYCYCVLSNGIHKKLYIEKRERLKLLARPTAEGVIDIGDTEWN